METTYIDIVFEGKKFSPKLLKEMTQLNIESLVEYGEISKRGRFKNTPSPYGLGLLKLNNIEEMNIDKSLNMIVDNLLSKKSILNKCGVEEITLDLESFSQNEIEYKISREIIKKISNLNASIEISSIPNLRKVKIEHLFHKHNNKIYSFYVDEIYRSMINDSNFLSNFSNVKRNRLDFIFKNRINEVMYLEIDISHAELTSKIIIFVLKYSEDSNVPESEIPSFKRVLSE
ncbi:hypothetical protein [Flavobacterium sp.]|uniref:hypothetical protein n=1 Tax=Flavobacterium sp. TaxID=239 RepID=UPI002487D6CC|nr:hypothetical protein [Flavobacterium sp.]MDI1316265.1 hypothetical protein [Flavobacterium sp.]